MSQETYTKISHLIAQKVKTKINKTPMGQEKKTQIKQYKTKKKSLQRPLSLSCVAQLILGVEPDLGNS